MQPAVEKSKITVCLNHWDVPDRRQTPYETGDGRRGRAEGPPKWQSRATMATPALCQQSRERREDDYLERCSLPPPPLDEG